MRIFSLIVFFFTYNIIICQLPFPLMISRINNPACETRVKVKDVNGNNCGPFLIYPVLIEDFNHKEDLPNNWGFNNGFTSDDDYHYKDVGFIWMGTSEEAYNNNLTVVNGEANLIVKKETNTNKVAYDNSSTGGKVATAKTYYFTGAVLSSRFAVRNGVFKANIKLPNNNTMFPAFWLRSPKQEIDIFEFYDEKLSGTQCDTYHQMKMTMHGGNFDNSVRCKRDRKVPVPSNFFTFYHDYECTWTDFRTDIFLDGQKVAYANRFYEGPYQPTTPCVTNSGSGSGTPKYSYGCTAINALDECEIRMPNIPIPPKPKYWPSNWAWPPIPWPFDGHCVKDYEVDRDDAYPLGIPSEPMGFRISNAIVNSTNSNLLDNSWNSYSSTDKQVSVDRVEVWQAIDCSATYNLNTLSDFNSLTGFTSFLGGAFINFGNALNNSSFVNIDPKFNGYKEYPIHILATDQIAFIGGDVILEEGTFFRGEIIDCYGNASSMYSRNLINEHPKFLNDDDTLVNNIKTIDEDNIEEFLKNHPEQEDSLKKLYTNEYFNGLLSSIRESSGLISSTDNGSIIVYPNPTKDFINIDMVEEDFNDILYLELTNSLGQNTRFEKVKQIDLSGYASGMYQLKFVFSHGFIVVKSITKL